MCCRARRVAGQERHEPMQSKLDQKNIAAADSGRSFQTVARANFRQIRLCTRQSASFHTPAGSLHAPEFLNA